jgi:low temperature requirement protein LtrA
VVVVDRLCLADERGRSRGGPGPDLDLRRDGGAADRRAQRSGRLQETGLEFAAAYGAVRAGHIALFILASRDDPGLRRSTLILAIGTFAGTALLIGGSFLDPGGQAAIWSIALLFDLTVPYFFGTEGWRLAPGHFAERHWLIIIVALGESVVALGVGAEAGLTLAVITTAVLGIVLVSEMWWVYFDVVALVGARRLVRAAVGREQNALARDAYSYLHFILVAGIVIAAFGLHEALLHPKDPLASVFAFGLLGGTAVYLIGHVCVRLRHVRTLNRQRLLITAVCFSLIPLAGEIAALATLAILTGLLAAMIAYETASYGENRARLRYAFDHEGAERPA